VFVVDCFGAFDIAMASAELLLSTSLSVSSSVSRSVLLASHSICLFWGAFALACFVAALIAAIGLVAVHVGKVHGIIGDDLLAP
jgi:hypothetical protein